MFGHHHHQHGPRRCGPQSPEADFAQQCNPYCDPRRAFARFGDGRHGHFERGFGGRGGGGRERMFDAGDLQLILLQLIAEKPSYGYELIKVIEERMGGGYAPSPGVVYPTLTLLEERGFARIEPSTEPAGSTRKVYAITDEGRAELERNADRLRDLTGRVDRQGQRFRRGRAPEVMRAFGDLRRAVLRASLRSREAGGPIPEDKFAKIVEAIEHAAQIIDSL